MPMKFRAHDTFFIRKGWLSKGMRCIAKKPDVFIAHDENPMDVLGIGAGERVMGSIVALCPLIPFEEREVDDPKGHID